MVKQYQKKNKDNKNNQLQSKKLKLITKKKVSKHFGRPIRTPKESLHEQYFVQTKQINEIIAFLSASFSSSQDFYECDANTFSQFGFDCLGARKFQQSQLSFQDLQKFGGKNTILYWLHFVVQITQRNKWHPHQLLNLILLWFSYQNLLPIKIKKLTQQLISNNSFSKEVFEKKVVRNNQSLNLLVILVVQIASFEDLDFIQFISLDDFASTVQSEIKIKQIEDQKAILY